MGNVVSVIETVYKFWHKDMMCGIENRFFHLFGALVAKNVMLCVRVKHHHKFFCFYICLCQPFSGVKRCRKADCNVNVILFADMFQLFFVPAVDKVDVEHLENAEKT